MAFLSLTSVRMQFGAFTAVEDFSLEVDRGEFVSFLGPSGCGKTTTLRMIAGFERPTSGVIRLDGVDITHRPPNRRNVGMVFQSYALFPNMTVAANVGFGLRIMGRSRAEIDRRVGELLRLIHLEDRAGRFPYQLSGGQQQRVALARALAIEPQVLLLDEPLSALDAKIRISLRQEIREIQRQLGITTIYVTHDQEEALSLSDRIVVMSDGRIEQVGTPFETYNFPATPFVASFVGTLNTLDGRIAADGALEVAGERVTAERHSGGRAGTTARLAIRPEMLRLGEPGVGESRLHGTLRDVAFLGSVVRLRIRLADGVTDIHVDEFNTPALQVPEAGAPVIVAVPPAAVLVLDVAAA
jgi:putative spermidine/putrescine transport system ATP-binding protein